MAKKKKAPVLSSIPNFQYMPNGEARAMPRTLRLGGKRVAIGGPVTIRQTPPALSVHVPEATPEQYAALYEMGYSNLVDRVEIAAPQPEESPAPVDAEENE